MDSSISPAELASYLHTHIPLSGAMGVSVAAVSGESVTVTAPLEPNINHRGTVFGGSASAVAVIAAWSLLHLRVREAGLNAQLVIQRNTMDYDKPINGAFTARSELANPDRWERFLRTLERRGRSRIGVDAVLTCEGELAGHLHGEFVAIVGEEESAPDGIRDPAGQSLT